MIHTHLNFVKRDLIEYLLFQYHFKSRISVWLLNYIKTAPPLIEQIRFVDEVVPGHATLEMAVSDTPFIAIHYHDGAIDLKNTNEIFQHVIHHQSPLDLKIHFHRMHPRDQRLDHVLLHQLMAIHNEDAYLKDMYTLEFSKSTELQLLRTLESHIDLSLRLKDISAFQHYSKLLNLIKLRHMPKE